MLAEKEDAWDWRIPEEGHNSNDSSFCFLEKLSEPKKPLQH